MSSGTDQQSTPLSAEEEKALRAGAEFWPVDTVRRLLATLDAAREGPSALDEERLAQTLVTIRELVDEAMVGRLLAGKQSLPARLTEPDAGGTATLDHIAWAQAIRLKHEATHGEAEQCGAECIAVGLAEFDYEYPA